MAAVRREASRLSSERWRHAHGIGPRSPRPEHDTQQLASHSIYEHQRRRRDRAGRLDLARSFRRAARSPLQSLRRTAGRPMVLERSIHARRQRRKWRNRIYSDGTRGAAKIGCHTFRATGITAYLEAGGTLENAQAMAAHERDHDAR
jgi:hypothetical protein